MGWPFKLRSNMKKAARVDVQLKETNDYSRHI